MPHVQYAITLPLPLSIINGSIIDNLISIDNLWLMIIQLSIIVLIDSYRYFFIIELSINDVCFFGFDLLPLVWFSPYK